MSQAIHKKFDSAARKSPTSGVTASVHPGLGGSELVSTGAKWERQVGYSRAIARGPFVFVSGTSAVEQSTGNVLHKGDPYNQAKVVFEIAKAALVSLGSSLDDVVRTRVFLRDLARDSAHVSKAHGEYLGECRPASSMIEVQRLVHPDVLVLIEFDAIRTVKD